MAEIRARYTGHKQALKELKNLERRYPEALAAAMFEEGILIFNESQEQVPRDTQTLARSGIVFMRRIGPAFGVVIGYGVSYALPVHENEKADERRTARAEFALSNPGVKVSGAQVGKSKYLSDPFEEALPGIERRLVIRTKARLRTSGLLLTGTRSVRGRSK